MWEVRIRKYFRTYILGLLDKPDQGEVLFDGLNTGHLSDSQRDEIRQTRLGFVFPSVALISFITALEHVEFTRRVADYLLAQQYKRTCECLALVGLGKRLPI